VVFLLHAVRLSTTDAAEKQNPGNFPDFSP